MPWSPTSPVTGSAQTGLTSPTYTLSADTAPDSNGKQHYVSALGGTQTGVTAHSVSAPFTLTFVRPKTLKVLGQPNPVTGKYPTIPRNKYELLTRKGVEVASGQAPVVMLIRTTIEVPAGADSNDIASVRAGLSAHIGALSQQSSNIGDTANTGSL